MQQINNAIFWMVMRVICHVIRKGRKGTSIGKLQDLNQA